MRTFLSLLLSLSVVAVSALAADKAASPAAPPPGPGAPASVRVAPPHAPAAVVPPVIAELKDGSKIEMDADGSVLVLNADGSKTPVPDGVLTLRDSTTFAVKGGKRVDE